MKILIHAHVYYHDLWQELKNCINIIARTAECEAYITMPAENYNKREKWGGELLCPAKFIVSENRGYDVGPFIYVLNLVNLKQYDYVIKLHTKRNITTYPWYINGFDVSGSKWRAYLLRFCSTTANWQKSLQTLSEKDCGMIADARLILPNEIQQYESRMNEWEEILGTKQLKIKEYISGTMFAAKAKIFYPIVGKININDFSITNRNEKGSLAHVFEHLLGNLVGLARLGIKSFDGQKVSCLHHLWYKVHKFVWYHKQTPEKELYKILGIQVYKSKKPKTE